MFVVTGGVVMVVAISFQRATASALAVLETGVINTSVVSNVNAKLRLIGATKSEPIATKLVVAFMYFFLV
jgi:hypothetical protein